MRGELRNLRDAWGRIAIRHLHNPVCATEFQLGEELAYEEARNSLDEILSTLPGELAREVREVLTELLDDWAVVYGQGACDGPEGSRTKASALLAKMGGEG
jgi:hypothetical protein